MAGTHRRILPKFANAAPQDVTSLAPHLELPPKLKSVAVACERCRRRKAKVLASLPASP